MKIKDRSKPKAPPIEPGVYIAVCVGVVDLGEQYSEKFKNYANKLMFIWELPEELIEVDGEQKPRQLSKEFAFSVSKKGNLRAFLSSWNTVTYTDESFGEVDVFDQLGTGCQVSVALNETGEYSNVVNVMALPKGVTAPTAVAPLVRWDMEHWSDETFGMLPEWIQEKIKKSTQYQKEHTPTDCIEVAAPAAPVPTATAGTGGAPF